MHGAFFGLQGPLKMLPSEGVWARGVLRRLHEKEGPSGCPSFILQKGYEKLIVNQPDSDHGGVTRFPGLLDTGRPL